MRDGRVKRLEPCADAFLSLSVIDVSVPGNRNFADLGNEGRRIERTIAVDQQTRRAGQKGDCIKPSRQMPSQLRCADVPGDVAGKLAFGEPQTAIPGW